MSTKIKVEGKRVKAADNVEENRLLEEAKASLAAHAAADTRCIEMRKEAMAERGRAHGLQEMAKRLQVEATLLEGTAAVVDKWADNLVQQLKVLDAERAVLQQKESEAVEQWQRFRFSHGLPFFSPEVGPPAWFMGAYVEPGMAEIITPEERRPTEPESP